MIGPPAAHRDATLISRRRSLHSRPSRGVTARRLSAAPVKGFKAMAADPATDAVIRAMSELQTIEHRSRCAPRSPLVTAHLHLAPFSLDPTSSDPDEIPPLDSLTRRPQRRARHPPAPSSDETFRHPSSCFSRGSYSQHVFTPSSCFSRDLPMPASVQVFLGPPYPSTYGPSVDVWSVAPTPPIALMSRIAPTPPIARASPIALVPRWPGLPFTPSAAHSGRHPLPLTGPPAWYSTSC